MRDYLHIIKQKRVFFRFINITISISLRVNLEIFPFLQRLHHYVVFPDPLKYFISYSCVVQYVQEQLTGICVNVI
jgi:hypothetical protein